MTSEETTRLRLELLEEVKGLLIEIDTLRHEVKRVEAERDALIRALVR